MENSSNGIETFGSPLLRDVEFNQDGTLKQSGKQNIRFYNKKRLNFRAKLDDAGKPVIDPKTGIPFKDAFEEVLEFVRVETRGDTTIFDGVATDVHKRQFYRQYKFFREGKIPEGNPIEDFDFLQSPTIMELHMLGVHVIQQVAEMSDLECEAIKDQSGYEIRDIAAQWVRINSPDGQKNKTSRLEVENARLRRELEESRKAGGRHQPREVAPVENEPQEPVREEAPVETMELTPEQLASGKSRRKRMV
jgi:hypothetical protein